MRQTKHCYRLGELIPVRYSQGPL